LAWDGEEAESLVAEANFDLVILDLVLPKIDGWEVLKHIRTKKPSLPVLILSGRAEVEDRVKGLDLGADDYLAKPFSFSELSARVRALLRRSPNRLDNVLRVEDLELDRAERVVRRAGRRIDLTPHEFALLEYLMRNAGRCVTRAMIIEHVWNFSLDTITTNVVDVYINYLRNKVDQDFENKLIHTVRSVGYQLGGEEMPDATA
jgi:two-component system copper resistance phosphate regulon response regulator CusR